MAVMNELDPLGTAFARGSQSKPPWYYDTHDHDVISLLSTGPQSVILELGCGSGATGRAALRAAKAGRYVGIEVDRASADIAKESLSEVLIGDVATLDLSRFHGSFDALVASEVLEHLVDPWSVLRKLRCCLKPNAIVIASSPNISHWQIVYNLLKGRFRYAEYGVMDSTHLRWFTPESYRSLFVDSGFEIEALRPIRRMRWKARFLNKMTGGRAAHLLMKQMMVIARPGPTRS
jgi:2-polyprenyl-3-methyl-5-hydroxy-6-metoxy-1,4-benzoquinol methylase